jgi:hypothetical protein
MNLSYRDAAQNVLPAISKKLKRTNDGFAADAD